MNDGLGTEHNSVSIGLESDDVKNGQRVVSCHQISILDPLRCDFAIALVCGCLATHSCRMQG